MHRGRRHLRPPGARGRAPPARILVNRRVVGAGRGGGGAEVEMLPLVARPHEHYGKRADQTGGGRHPPEDRRVRSEQRPATGLRYHCHERVENRAELQEEVFVL